MIAQPLEPRMLFSVATSMTLGTQSITPIAGAQTIDLDSFFSGTGVPASTYDFTTTLGVIPVIFTPDVTPLTVANFLSYVNSGAYNNTVIHRLSSGFVWQSGEYTFDNSNNTFVTTPVGAGVQNEFSQSNTEGTIALAKLSGNENSGTDGFFFNLADNSGNLDSQNGGFTVFGHVAGTDNTTVTSAGLDVMTAIGNESTIDDGGDFDTLPVADSTAGVTQSNLLFINSVTPTATPYSVFSDNPSVVSASVSGNTLTFTPLQSGSANITVTALDSAGDTMTQTFAVNVAVPTAAEVIDAGNGVKTIVYTDGNNVTTKVSLSSGAATLNFTGYSIATTQKGTTETVTGTDVSLDSIDLIETARSSVLNITPNKDGATIGAINGGTPTTINSTPLKAINAPRVTLTGTSALYSSVVTASLESIAANAVFNVYAVGKLSISGAVPGEIEAATTLQQVTLKSTFTGALQAVSVGKFNAHDVSADFNLEGGIGILQIAGTFSGVMDAEFIDKATVTKMSNATITLTGTNDDLGTLKTQTMAGSTLEAVGSLGSIVISQPISASHILAGILETSAAQLADAVASDTDTVGEIVSLKIGGSATANSFADSSIGAAELRSVSIGNIVDQAPSDSSEFYGIAAQRILSLTARLGSKKFKLIDVASEGVLTTRLTTQNVVPTNVKFEIVLPVASTPTTG